MKLKNQPLVVIIKSSSWKSAYQSRNHPEYSAIFDLIERYGPEIRFVLGGTSRTPTSRVLLKNGAIAWDIQAGRLWNFTYYFDLMKLLVKHRPRLVIVLGLLNILPVAIYSLLSRKSKYIPVFIGEFNYYGRKRTGQLLMNLGFKALGISVQLSQRKILNAFAISRYVREGIEKLAPGLRGKIRLYSYSISPKFCSVKGHALSNEPVILTVAGIEPRKGLDVLIKALSLIPRRFKVIIKGSIRDTIYMRKLKAMVEDLGLKDKVTFITGDLDYDALASYYKSAALFVFPTREDSLGVVILEALHCGVPVIATSTGGIPEMIENGVNGMLVPANEPIELANTISLILNDDAIRKKLIKNARRVLFSRYYEGRITFKEALSQSLVACTQLKNTSTNSH